MGQGLCLRKKLWSTVGRQKLESLTLDPWASRRRRKLLELLDQLDALIEELDRAVISEAESRPAAVCLMQQPGVWPVTALAFELTVGPVSRFANSKKLVSYLGLNPSQERQGRSEASSDQNPGEPSVASTVFDERPASRGALDSALGSQRQGCTWSCQKNYEKV
jgi:transposase